MPIDPRYVSLPGQRWKVHYGSPTDIFYEAQYMMFAEVGSAAANEFASAIGPRYQPVIDRLPNGDSIVEVALTEAEVAERAELRRRLAEERKNRALDAS